MLLKITLTLYTSRNKDNFFYCLISTLHWTCNMELAESTWQIGYIFLLKDNSISNIWHDIYSTYKRYYSNAYLRTINVYTFFSMREASVPMVRMPLYASRVSILSSIIVNEGYSHFPPPSWHVFFSVRETTSCLTTTTSHTPATTCQTATTTGGPAPPSPRPTSRYSHPLPGGRLPPSPQHRRPLPSAFSLFWFFFYTILTYLLALFSSSYYSSSFLPIFPIPFLFLLFFSLFLLFVFPRLLFFPFSSFSFPFSGLSTFLYLIFYFLLHFPSCFLFPFCYILLFIL